MNNAIATRQPQAVATAPEFSLNDTFRMAQAIARGGLFGSKDENAVLTLCLLAQAEGQHPATVFRDYHMISGKPSKKSEAMQRDFLLAGGKIEWHRLDDEAADATFSHPLGGTVRIDWDLDRAKTAQLLGNAMWKKYPRQMLKARVISDGVRTVFPAATSGMYVPEEVMQFDEPTAKPARAAPPAPRAKRDIDYEQPAIEHQPDPAADRSGGGSSSPPADISPQSPAPEAGDARQKAEGFAEEFKSWLAECLTGAEVADLQHRYEKNLRALQQRHADLSKEIAEATEDRIAELEAGQ